MRNKLVDRLRTKPSAYAPGEAGRQQVLCSSSPSSLVVNEGLQLLLAILLH
jgi:hypothetical protein